MGAFADNNTYVSHRVTRHTRISNTMTFNNGVTYEKN